MEQRVSALREQLHHVRESIGHVLLEGVPGIAKTMMVNSLAGVLGAKFNRNQFTPDLLPGDLIGTQIYRDGSFETRKGPIFANLVLADKINRSPAKVQSALLEAMQEHQVTLGEETHKLPEPFMVLATQNPIEQEGTYSLPEAQVDRFMFKLIVDYPSMDEEHVILKRMARNAQHLRPNRMRSMRSDRARLAAELRRSADTFLPQPPAPRRRRNRWMKKTGIPDYLDEEIRKGIL